MPDQELEHKGEEVQLVVFELENETYAIEIHQVREIIKMVDVTPIPVAPSFIRGMINLRGEIVIVTDLKGKFNLKKERSGMFIVIVEVDDNTFGIIVDDVSKILRVPKEEIKKAPSIITKRIHADYIKGVVILDDKLVILLDPSEIYSEDEFGEIDSAEKKAAGAKTKGKEAKKVPREGSKKEEKHKREKRKEKR